MYLVYYDVKRSEHFTIYNIKNIKNLNNEEIEIKFEKDMETVIKRMRKEDVSSIGIIY